MAANATEQNESVQSHMELKATWTAQMAIEHIRSQATTHTSYHTQTSSSHDRRTLSPSLESRRNMVDSNTINIEVDHHPQTPHLSPIWKDSHTELQVVDSQGERLGTLPALALICAPPATSLSTVLSLYDSTTVEVPEEHRSYEYLSPNTLRQKNSSAHHVISRTLISPPPLEILIELHMIKYPSVGQQVHSEESLREQKMRTTLHHLHHPHLHISYLLKR